MKYDKQTDFLISELIQCTINASLMTRNTEFPVYSSKNIASKAKDEFKKEIKNYLLEYLNDYKSFNEEKHIERIVNLSDHLSAKYSEILYNGRFRIGISQKLINLFSKYMWVIKKIDCPFHCPIDRIIKFQTLKGTENKTLTDWTVLDTIDGYNDYIKIIRNKSGELKLSIAEWELDNWKKVIP